MYNFMLQSKPENLKIYLSSKKTQREEAVLYEECSWKANTAAAAMNSIRRNVNTQKNC